MNNIVPEGQCQFKTKVASSKGGRTVGIRSGRRLWEVVIKMTCC